MGFMLSYEFSDAKNGFYGIENIYFHSHPLYTPKNRDFSVIFGKKLPNKKQVQIDDFSRFFLKNSKTNGRIFLKISENEVLSYALL